MIPPHLEMHLPDTLGDSGNYQEKKSAWHKIFEQSEKIFCMRPVLQTHSGERGIPGFPDGRVQGSLVASTGRSQDTALNSHYMTI